MRFIRLLLLELFRIYIIVAVVAALVTYRLAAMCGSPDVAYALRMGASWPAWIRSML